MTFSGSHSKYLQVTINNVHQISHELFRLEKLGIFTVLLLGFATLFNISGHQRHFLH